MKKRLISALLTVAMVATMVVLPVSAEEETTLENITAVTEQCPCGCGQTLDQVSWQPWNVNVDGDPVTGHYYLADDYAQTTSQRTVISGHSVVLDLRGHTLTTDEYRRLFLIYGYMAVLDTVGGGKIMSKTSGSAYGGVIMVTVNETLDATFELHSGTLTVDPDNKGSLRGGIVSVGKNSVFRMTGGVISNGRTHSQTSTNTALQGGAIAATDAEARIEILGGTIMNCSANASGGAIYSKGTMILKNCRILNGSANGYGGNVCQSGGSLTMENCEIAYGSTAGNYGGGNLYVASSAVFTDNGSTIRDGYTEGGSSSGGGNIYLGTGTYTLIGTTVKGGVSQKYGANILNTTANTTRMIDCNIDGDVRWSGAGLSLEGKTKIGLRGNGLNLVGSSAGNIISASKLTDGAEVYVSAYYGVFTNDAANLDYFKPALRTVLTQKADGTLSGKMAADGEVAGYCPHCNEKVAWQAFTAASDTAINESGHYYLSKSATARLNIAADQDVVIDLNGMNITSGHRALVLKKNAKLSILDFNGAGKVTGKGGATSGSPWNGGVIYGEGVCTLNIYGGSFTYTSQAEKHAPKGGVIYVPASSEVNIYGGTLDGRSYNKTDEGNNGGAVYIADSAKSFTMSAGRIFGGTANQGGTVVFGKSVDVEITGGVISGGTSTSSGGNVRFAGASGAKGTATLRDCAVLDGRTTAAGGYSGNMHIYYYTVDMDNCFISGGVNEKAYGGNIACSSGSTTTAADTIFVGGKAARGGNFYMTTTDLTATFNDCMILDGEAYVPEGSTGSVDGYGGNMFGNNGAITFNGGVISGGTAQRGGGNVYANAGNADATDKLVWKKGTAVPQLTGGRAGTYGGNLYVVNAVELDCVYIAGGAAKTAGSDVYVYNGAKLAMHLGSGLTGSIAMATASALLGEGTYGEPITGVTADKFSANIVMEAVSGQPGALSYDSKLVVAGATVVNADGEETWYVDNAQAAAACGENEYLKLYTINDLVLTKALTVDFNGQTVAVSGNYQLSGMDSSGDGYELPKGKASGAVNAAEITYAPNGNIYLPVEESGEITFHRVGMQITDVALRPSEAGLYYKAAFGGDSVVKGIIAEYGIAASLADVPDNDFREDPDSDSLWVGFTGEITNDTKKCGVVVKDILKQGNTNESNNENGRTSVFATAYITLKDGATYVSEQKIAYSLYDFMEQLDTLIQEDPTHYRRLEKRTKEFYGAWENKGLEDWTFDRLKAPEDPATDGILNVLMIGSSGCYYYVEELYALLKEAGIESRICNVYYSGGLLSQHYNWWKKDLSNYQFFVTDATGRRKVSNQASLEYCLSFYNWDVITLQESGTGKLREIDAQTFFSERQVYLDTLYGYLGQEFPQAELMWQENGAYQIGYSKAFLVNSLEDQISDTENFRMLSQAIAEEYDIRWIPRGEGSLNFYKDSGLPGTLCARLGIGTNHEGDYYHDGDIGGGQLLTACVWFESLTGLSCLDSEYVPVYTYEGQEYTLSDELVTAVRAAAHKAVQEWFVTQ